MKGLRWAVVLTMTATVWFPSPSTSWASPTDCTESAEEDGSGFTQTIRCEDDDEIAATGPQPGAGTPNPSGTWVLLGPVCATGSTCSGMPLCDDGTPPKRYVLVRPDGSSGAEWTGCPSTDDPEPPPETVSPPTDGEIFEAFRRAAPTKSTLDVQPPNGKTLVNFETIFSTQAEAFSTGPLALGRGFRVVFDIFPTSFTWDLSLIHI